MQGARYALLAATEGIANAFAVAHPTKTVPEDYGKAAEKDGLFLLAETDGMFPAAAVEATRALNVHNRFVFHGPWPKTNHGFVVRGDDAVPEVASGRAQARAAAAQFFMQLATKWEEAK